MNPHSDVLKGRHILLVEDEYFIADDMRRGFAEYGASVVGPVGSLKEALDLAAREDIDGAVLDINLRGEMVYPVADVLRARGVPYLFLTGYDAKALPKRYSAVTRCEKPLAIREVVAALGSAPATA